MRNLILAMMLLLPTVASTEDQQQVFVAGIGAAISCGKVVAALETSPLGKHLGMTRNGTEYVTEKYAFLAFVAGYVTAVNIIRGPSRQIMVDNPATELWIRNYCTAHPTDILARAAQAFADSQVGEPLR